MEPVDNKDKYGFLQGGGELGALTRSYNWSATAIGTPDTWPMNLRLTVAMMLRSKFPMFLWWGDDLTQFYNDAYRPSLGSNGKHPQALGQKGKDCWPEIWDIISPLINQVRTTGEATWSEDQLVPIYRNGKIEDVYWTFGYSAITDEDGKTDGVLVICTETTEKVENLKRQLKAKDELQESEEHFRLLAEAARRKLAEKAYKETKQRFNSLVESAPFPIGVFIGKEMRVELANQAILDAWGKGNEVIGKLFTAVLPEFENQDIFKHIAKVYSSGKAFHARNQRVDIEHEGKLTPYYFNYSLTPLFDEMGHVYGVMNTAADVTDLNLAKQKVELSERNVRNMILQAPVAMCILLGPAHVVEVANQLMIELWGKPVEDVMNKPIFEGLPDAREQGLEQLLDDVYHTGEPFTANERPITLLRNGKIDTVYQNFVYEPYKDADGSILGVLAITIDVTAQVLARLKIEDIVNARTNELATANQQLQRSNDELAQFAYIASHDLQEPLRKVVTYAQMLEMSLEDMSERSEKYLGKIQNSTSRMSVLVRDVLAYSQLSKAHTAFAPVDLKMVVDDISTDFELLIEQKRAQIRCKHLPVIEAIPLQMTQLFGNLISNALKFSVGDKEVIIDIEARDLNKQEVKQVYGLNEDLFYYSITVGDNGIGFDQEHAEQIFNIFQRLHGKTEYSGTGIGLAMCKKIALNHGGEIFAKSSPGCGTVFTILLPKDRSGSSE
jgi:PAS domain S-box-containing protein